ncbi:hypothetical protein VST7929_01140 [Vibrio stylophorae]|uniref:YnhF family membrane protein n=1 Tax=Vibrio stylophorae TaxID=659351 RepID=A0ABM8ZSL4_9VIBR|nr:YnhF family membrane protein [Vibrio stylophorae]CAH0533276.1 hypothetical protein VST7929_01140 [Vibrio stylophorae]
MSAELKLALTTTAIALAVILAFGLIAIQFPS